PSVCPVIPPLFLPSPLWHYRPSLSGSFYEAPRDDESPARPPRPSHFPAPMCGVCRRTSMTATSPEQRGDGSFQKSHRNARQKANPAKQTMTTVKEAQCCLQCIVKSQPKTVLENSSSKMRPASLDGSIISRIERAARPQGRKDLQGSPAPQNAEWLQAVSASAIRSRVFLLQPGKRRAALSPRPLIGASTSPANAEKEKRGLPARYSRVTARAQQSSLGRGRHGSIGPGCRCSAWRRSFAQQFFNRHLDEDLMTGSCQSHGCSSNLPVIAVAKVAVDCDDRLRIRDRRALRSDSQPGGLQIPLHFCAPAVALASREGMRAIISVGSNPKMSGGLKPPSGCKPRRNSFTLLFPGPKDESSERPSSAAAAHDMFPPNSDSWRRLHHRADRFVRPRFAGTPGERGRQLQLSRASTAASACPSGASTPTGARRAAGTASQRVQLRAGRRLGLAAAAGRSSSLENLAFGRDSRGSKEDKADAFLRNLRLHTLFSLQVVSQTTGTSCHDYLSQCDECGLPRHNNELLSEISADLAPGAWAQPSDRTLTAGKAVRQQAAIWELCQTELNILRHLKTIIEIYIAVIHYLQSSASLLLDVDTDRLFPDVAAVFSSPLRPVDEAPPAGPRACGHIRGPVRPRDFAEGFIRFGRRSSSRRWPSACGSPRARTTFVSWRKTKRSTTSGLKSPVLKNYNSNDCSMDLQLKSLLTMPFQRLTKYGLLLQEIQRHTEDGEGSRGLGAHGEGLRVQ
uniref:DH domain-containing protein n=1 Tax=Macrostomum lignano TaxID=282301 RepID=A0A1I8FP71_9PLAT